MLPRFAQRSRLQAAVIVGSMTCAMGTFAQEAPPDADSAAALRGQYAALSEQLEQSPIQRGLYLESVETSRSSRGDIYAVVGFGFTAISDNFTRPENWCEALILHLNVKYCHATARDERTVLSVALGKKTEQPLKDTHRVEFNYEVTVAGPEYTQVILDARKGPLGTRNYHILLEWLALDSERSFLHIRYAYEFGRVARLAMRFYLSRSGSSKVGFTMIENEKGGPPHLVGGLRAAQERNTMRYFLAIDAYLGALATSPADRFEESLEKWFAATERYALQLHEVEHDDYIEMKRREHQRQQQTPP
ncbi:MAG TPA: hypothetical protein VFO82_04505 [Steroidobacteraceae bacterium]|nr:hypothetical protein [Steroidobacteraceae bacterium]